MLTRDAYCAIISGLLEPLANAAPVRKVWRLDMADALECSTEAIDEWIRGTKGPGGHHLTNLFEYLPGFREDYLRACGHDVEAPPSLSYRLRKLADELETAK